MNIHIHIKDPINGDPIEYNIDIPKKLKNVINQLIHNKDNNLQIIPVDITLGDIKVQCMLSTMVKVKSGRKTINKRVVIEKPKPINKPTPKYNFFHRHLRRLFNK